MAGWEEAQPAGEFHERAIATVLVDLCVDASRRARIVAFHTIVAGQDPSPLILTPFELDQREQKCAVRFDRASLEIGPATLSNSFLLRDDITASCPQRRTQTVPCRTAGFRA